MYLPDFKKTRRYIRKWWISLSVVLCRFVNTFITYLLQDCLAMDFVFQLQMCLSLLHLTNWFVFNFLFWNDKSLFLLALRWCEGLGSWKTDPIFSPHYLTLRALNLWHCFRIAGLNCFYTYINCCDYWLFPYITH